MTLRAAVGGSAVCLPFFVSAPRTMWRMVVLDQLERPDISLSYVRHLNALTGLTPFRLVEHAPALILVATACAVVAVALAWTVHIARAAATLLMAMGVTLIAAPSFFAHYAAAIAVRVAVVVGPRSE